MDSLMNTDEKMVSDVVLANGLRKVEVIRFAKPVEVDAWVEKMVPDHSMDTWTFWDFVEDPTGLKLNHLYLYWRQRGPVDFSRLPGSEVKYGVLWWIEKGESLSFSADVAATLHKRWCGRMPSTAWVKKLPANANTSRTQEQRCSGAQKPRVLIEVGEGDDHVMLELRVGDWVPERYVVVGIPL